MSDHAAAVAEHSEEHDHTVHVAPAKPLSQLFDAAEIREFDSEDKEAGRNICKMLSLFFFYTVIVMGLSTYVTIRWVM